MIIPAFDLIDNKIVRLYQGDYNQKKNYDINLFDYINDYKLKGVKIVHVVDLEAARNSQNKQLKFLKKLLSYSNIAVQIGGGIRNEKDLNTFLQLGAKRVVIGSSAITNKIEVKKWLQIYGSNSIVLALDVCVNNKNDKIISIHGWKDKTQYTLEEIIEYFSPIGLKHVLCTDISKDGTLSGPNINLYREIVNKFKHIKFQASGGISSLNDILLLKKTNVSSIIIGRSLLEKKFTVQEALRCWQKE